MRDTERASGRINDPREKFTPYYLSRTVDAEIDEVVQRVTAGLKEEGFGGLTDIDVQVTLKSRLGADMPPYRIVGARNRKRHAEAV